MSILTSIAGPSGAGKTRSFKDLDWDESFVIRPNRKPFSFPGSGKLKPWDSEKKTGHYIYLDDYIKINSVLERLPEYGKKVIIIDDSTHLLLKQTMDTAKEKGFDKFLDSALNYYNLLIAAQSLPDDVRVYIINHIDLDANGDEIVKVVGGKFITEKIDVPSMLTVAIRATKTKDGYKFKTQSNGRDFYKSPEDMFKDEYIDNELKTVDDAICDYYGIEKNKQNKPEE